MITHLEHGRTRVPERCVYVNTKSPAQSDFVTMTNAVGVASGIHGRHVSRKSNRIQKGEGACHVPQISKETLVQSPIQTSDLSPKVKNHLS